ncbi:MAG: HEAT repeat domain-containing protein [Actinobacteria bacterium]|nr:HEAT repeat domain-containing protein [Actinomycetota bacterium]MBO0834862.1 HEAT repeat domain-containing protein [Actinomycetota bacterium]
MFWCFHCYAVNDYRTGPCRVCGGPVEGPASLSRAEGLAWALRHPDGDRAVLAAKILGQLRARESVPALREAAESGLDIYLRAEALRSVIAIEGADTLGPWLEELGRSGPMNVRAIARHALESTGPADTSEPNDRAPS